MAPHVSAPVARPVSPRSAEVAPATPSATMAREAIVASAEARDPRSPAPIRAVDRDEYTTTFRSVDAPRGPGPGGVFKLYFGSLLSSVARARVAHLTSATMFNIEAHLDAKGRFALDRHAIVFAFGGHIENPGDGLVMLTRWKHMPKIGHGREKRRLAIHVLKRVGGGAMERFMFRKVLGDVTIEVASKADRQEAETARAEAQKRGEKRLPTVPPSPREALEAAAARILPAAGQVAIYTEGVVDTDGPIWVRSIGALEAFTSKGPVPVLAATHTYEPFTDSAIRPFVNFAKKPFLIEVQAPGASPEEVEARRKTLRKELERIHSELSVLTTTGITGVYLLRAREAGATEFSRAQMHALISAVVSEVQEAKLAGKLEVELDPRLLDPSTRARAVEAVFARLTTLTSVDRNRFERPGPYLEAIELPATPVRAGALRLLAGRAPKATTYRITDALGPRVALGETPPLEAMPKREVRRDPLGVWGRRLDQQASHLPELEAVFSRVFARFCPALA